MVSKPLSLLALAAAGAQAAVNFYITDFDFAWIGSNGDSGDYTYSFQYFETNLEFIGTCSGSANNATVTCSSGSFPGTPNAEFVTPTVQLTNIENGVATAYVTAVYGNPFVTDTTTFTGQAQGSASFGNSNPPGGNFGPFYATLNPTS